MPPLGYDVVPEGGRIVVNKDEADHVRAIFDLYLEKGSLLGVAEELNRRDWRRKSWTTKNGRIRVGRSWNIVDVQRLLRDPIYTGRQKLGDETFPGEHSAIVTKSVFEQVQRILDENRRNSGATHRNHHGALLRGILRCAACDSAMTHTFNTNRHGKTYRYYRCVNSVKSGADACPTGSVSAIEIEALVVDQIKRIGADQALCEETFRQVQAQAANERRALKSEAKRIERELATARAELDQLTTALARATGSAADVVIAKLSEAQKRIVVLERRQREIGDQQTSLAAQDVDSEAVARAVAQFTEVWDVLLTPERERLVQLLIERIDYDGTNSTVTFGLSAAGARVLVTETSP